MRALIVVVAALLAAPAVAQTKPTTGDFVISGSQLAPWADAKSKIMGDELRTLQGKGVAFRPKGIAAPAPLGCKGARYKFVAYEPEGLFQGTLTAPKKQAAALGFVGEKIWTLETGCEIDFHFVDPDHALFGLNDMVYTITRKPK